MSVAVATAPLARPGVLRTSTTRLLWLIVLHVALGVAMRASDIFATAEALLTLGGAALVVVQTRRLEWVAAAAGHVVASEVLWRMTDARVFWETGKYALLGLCGLAMFRFFRRWRRISLPAAYLAMFLPAVVLALLNLNLGLARQLISFNLSGPLALAVAVLFFAQIRTDLAALRLVLWAMTLPVVSVATIALVNTVSAGTIRFTFESNFTTSGGFGPNQVSATLGLGALLALLLALTERTFRLQAVELALALWFLGHAILTFSRGGVVNVAVAVGLALLASARQVRSSGRFAVLVVLVVVVAGYVVFPRLDRYTGGNLGVRYSETQSNRGNIAEDELALFRDNPIAGSGLGVASTQVGESAADVARVGLPGERVAAHTEYTRLLAEQGLFGLGAIVILGLIALDAFRRARPGLPRAFVAAFAGWSLTEMTHAAMRLAVIGFVLALAVAASSLIETDEDAGQRVPTGQ